LVFLRLPLTAIVRLLVGVSPQTKVTCNIRNPSVREHPSQRRLREGGPRDAKESV